MCHRSMWSWKMLACRWNLIFFSLISCTRIYDSSHVILQSSCISFRQYVLFLNFGCSKRFKCIYWHVCVNHKSLWDSEKLHHLSYILGVCKYLQSNIYSSKVRSGCKNISQTHSEVKIFINFQVHIGTMQNFTIDFTCHCS